MAGLTETARKQAATLCLVGLALIALYLCYLLARPFLGPVVVAVMLAIVFHPLHHKIQSAAPKYPSLAAGLSTAAVLLVVTIPIVLLGISVSSELRSLIQSLREQSWSQGGLTPYLAHWADRLLSRFGSFVNLAQFDPHAALLRWAEQASSYLVSKGAAVVTNIMSFFLDSVVVFCSLFFLFRDGKSVLQELSAMLPLRPDQTENLLTRISDTLVANLYGGLAVGAAQGVLVGLSFWALGLPAPILWTLVTAIVSLIPVFGSAIVWGPAAIFLLLGGHWVKALIILCWGAAVVSQIDVLVRPYVVSTRAKVRGLLVFFALLGGVKAFGVVGLFVGPVILSLTLAILEMLKHTNLEWHEQAASTLELTAK